jgi:hypothetical protein
VNPQGYPPQQGYPQQGYPQQGYPPQQPPPKKGKGCLIAALVTGGLLLVVGIVVVVFIVIAAKKVTAIAAEGMNAPGTPALRAAGCDIPIVMDVGKMFDSGASSGSSANATLIVSCSVNTAGKTPPTCDDVAKTYVKAVTKASGKFLAQVQVQGKSKPECQKLYSDTGAYLGEAKQ